MNAFLRTCLLACLMLLPWTVLAQEAGSTDIKHQMSPAEFHAAGLDKLSDKELAALNAWLNHSTQAQSQAVQQAQADAQQARTEAAQAKAQAATAHEEGRQEVITKNRGFFDFGSSEPIESTIAGEFAGFGKGRTWTLANGQVWQQVDGATLAGVRKSNPDVSIRPGVLGAWYMKIKGYNTAASVKRVK